MLMISEAFNRNWMSGSILALGILTAWAGSRMISFDPTLTIGAVLNMLTFLVGGTVFAVSVRADVRALAFRVGLVERAVESMQEILKHVAVQDERLNTHARRIEAMEARLFKRQPLS